MARNCELTVPQAYISFPDGTRVDVSSMERKDNEGRLRGLGYEAGVVCLPPKVDTDGNFILMDKGEAGIWGKQNGKLIEDLRCSLEAWAKERGLMLEEAEKIS